MLPLRAWLVTLLGFVLTGCGADSILCTMGEITRCTCPDGQKSVQVCSPQGLPGMCQCLPNKADDAGVGTAGGSPTGVAGASDNRDAGTPAPLGPCTSRALTFRPVDVEYATSLGFIVAVTANPNALVIFNPHREEATTVPLPHEPAAVSVSADGKTAAVGHDRFVSIVDLLSGSLQDTIPITSDTGDIVLASNGFAYVFPRTGGWVDIHSVEIARRVDHGGALGGFYRNTRARLHPGGTSIYSIDTIGTPNDVARSDIGGNLPSKPVRPRIAYPLCDNLWFTENGDRLITACGTAFRASPGASDDMTPAGPIHRPASSTSGSGTGRYQWITHSKINHAVYAIPRADGDLPSADGSNVSRSEDTRVHVHADDSLFFEQALDIPCVRTRREKLRVHGRYAFVTALGDQLFVLGEVDPTSDGVDDWAFARIELWGPPAAE